MERCPECFGEIEDMGDYLECVECNTQFEVDSEDDDYEEIDPGDRL